MTALVAVGVTVAYGDRLALDEVSVAVPRGELCALLGHNGSGKSTLLRAAAGLLAVQSGTVTVLGEEPGSIEARAATSYLGDTPVLYDDLSVGEHLEFVARLHGCAAWEPRADELLDRLGLVPRRDELPTQLSRGLRQKAAIAIAFVRPFEVLLVDEPFVGLDTGGRAALVDLVRDAARAGAAVLLATHQLETLAHADRAIVLGEGRVVHDGPPADLPRELLGDDLR